MIFTLILYLIVFAFCILNLYISVEENDYLMYILGTIAIFMIVWEIYLLFVNN